MNKLYQKIPFLLELFINGSFVFIYSFYTANKLESSLVSPVIIEMLLEVFTYTAPFVVLLSVISFYIRSKSSDDFFRRYIFSLICVIPMFITYGDLQFAFWLAAVHLFSSVLSLYETPRSKETKKQVQKVEKASSILEQIKLNPCADPWKSRMF